MTQKEIRELNEEVLNSLFFERKYLICELKYHISTTSDLYLLATNVGFISFGDTFYPYEESVCELYLIMRIWIAYDFSLIQKLRKSRSPSNMRKIIESENLELVYSRESTKENKTDNIINKYGLVT